jgi:hypothetical protein
MLFAIAQSGLLGVELRQSSLAKFVAVNKELYNVDLGSPFCGWYFRREFIAFLTQKEEPRLYDRAYLLTLLQLLHRTHVNPIDNGRSLRVTRRITDEGLKQPIVANSV